MIVQNIFPKLSAPFRLALVGEAPGADEEVVGQPFVGASGRLLRGTLGKLGISDHQVFFGNICQHRPPGNDIEEFDLMSPEMVSGRAAIFADLQTFQPNCVCLLGGSALKTFRQNADAITDFRGSLFLSDLTPVPWKCLATLHPAAVLRQYGMNSVFKMDLKRALDESKDPELVLPTRTYITRPTLEQVLSFIETCRSHVTAFDIEGYADHVGVTMCSFSYDPATALVVPFYIDGQHYWSEDEEAIIWQSIGSYLSDVGAPKVCQNALYETFVLGWRHKVIVRGLVDDTMLAHWEMFPEFPKNLGFQTSIYTREPFYKEERLSDDTDVKLTYNGKDSCVTKEIIEVVRPRLEAVPPSFEHYRFNVDLIEPFTYMHLRGCAFDMEAFTRERVAATEELERLNLDIQQELSTSDFNETFPDAQKKYGGFNVKSVNHKKWLLYVHLGFKPYSKSGQSTAAEVILKYRARHGSPLLTKVFRAVQKRTRLSDLGKLTTNDDGRIRSSYNTVATNTGRLNSSASNARVYYHTKKGLLKYEQTGTNLQNVTKELRVCFTADSPEFDFFQCDLSGADGWTVAADLAALGHPTMLDDYRFGIKPAKVLLLMLDEHAKGGNPANINSLDRPTLLALTQAIDTEEDDGSGRPAGWKYLCMKRVQHGTNYDAQPPTVADTIFEDSEGSIELTPTEAGLYQWFYKLRYNPGARSQYVLSELSAKGYLTAACGIRRKFFDIRNPRNIEPATLRAALSFEPQANTTWATNAALRKLYYDPENRNSQGHLFVEPLLQIHDALAGQYRKKHREWASKKFRQWFNNPLKIHGIDITIPYEGQWGPNWKFPKTESGKL